MTKGLAHNVEGGQASHAPPMNEPEQVAGGTMGILQQPRIKISINTDKSVNEFYGNIGKISVDIFTKISVINFFLYFNYIDYEK